MASKSVSKTAPKASAKSKTAAPAAPAAIINNNNDDEINTKLDNVKQDNVKQDNNNVKQEVKKDNNNVKPDVKEEVKKDKPVGNKLLLSKDFKPENVNFGTIYTDQYDNRSIKTTYNNKDFYMIAQGCSIVSFKLEDNGKYKLYVNITDENFINAVKSYDDSLIVYGSKNSKIFFDDDMSESECIELFKPKTLQYHEKYKYSISSYLKKKDFICKSKTEDVSDVSDLSVALQKGNIVDICFDFMKIKLGQNKYSVGIEIKQVNIISASEVSSYKSNAISPEEFNIAKLSLSEIETLEKGNKKSQILYGEDDSTKPLRIKFENIKGRLFANKQPNEDKTSYSLNVRLNDPANRQMFDDINDESLKQIIQLSCKGLDAGKSALKSKLIKKEFKPIVSYSKADQEKIKKGEKPQWDPSIWFKIFHSDEKGFDGKIINTDNKKPIENTEELLAIKELNIKSLEIYNKHIWIGAKGISVNFTLNKCEVSLDVAPSYDMDFIDEDDSDTKKSAPVPKPTTDKATVKQTEKPKEVVNEVANEDTSDEEVENSSEEEEEESD